MISQRHPGVADVVVHELEGRSTSLHLSSAAVAAKQLARLQGLEVPTWNERVAGKETTSAKTLGEVEPGAHVGGWQQEAAAQLEWHFLEQLSVWTLCQSNGEL